ncbi:unnamed protein product [Discula destructiva]
MADIVNLAGIGYDRLTTNLRKSFDGMSAEKWIRIVIVVGAYCLLRPYLMKMGSKVQMKQYEKEAADTKAAEEEQAKMSPNELRGYKEIPEDSDDDDDQGGSGPAPGQAGQSTSTEWGKKARKRQRNTIKKILAAEEKRLQDLQDDDDDKDIEEFLT